MKNVLIVDDNTQSAELLKGIIQANSPESTKVFITGDIDTAIELVNTHTIDLILSDRDVGDPAQRIADVAIGNHLKATNNTTTPLGILTGLQIDAENPRADFTLPKPINIDLFDTQKTDAYIADFLSGKLDRSQLAAAMKPASDASKSHAEDVIKRGGTKPLPQRPAIGVHNIKPGERDWGR